MKLNDDILSLVNKSEFVTTLLEQKAILIDNSSFVNWQGCFVKGIFGCALRREPKRGATPLLYGGAVHVGLENQLMGDSWDVAIEKAVAFANEGNLDSYDDDRRNTGTLTDMLLHYKIDYEMREDKFSPVSVGGLLMVEQSFRFPLGKVEIEFPDGNVYPVTIYWQGKIDLIEQDSFDNLWIVDHKTTSVMGKAFPDTFLRSSQMLGYTWAGRKLTESLGKEIKGVKINALCSRSKGYEFVRFPLPMTSWAVDEWIDETLEECAQIANTTLNYLEDGIAMCNRSTCVGKYGKCQFFDVCQNAPKVRPHTLMDEDMFYTSDWSPLK